MNDWLGPVMLVLGVCALVVAIRTDCKSEYWTKPYGTISLREIILFFLGTFLLVGGLAGILITKW